MTQPLLFASAGRRVAEPFTTQLLKWVGNKQRFAHEIISYFPASFGTYFEPFLGSGAVLATLAPDTPAIGSDAFAPLAEIWRALQDRPNDLKRWYADRWAQGASDTKRVAYDRVRSSYNARPNGADLLYLCRSCYGGVVRFRKKDGHMSTPCGAHRPIAPDEFARRVDTWRARCRHVTFRHADYATAMATAAEGDLIYCDPPYLDTQSILYGAQSFSLGRLFATIEQCKARGVHVALSIDGTKRSGGKICDVRVPAGLFETEVLVNCGRSMLRRFQMAGQSLERETVADRLLLTYRPPT